MKKLPNPVETEQENQLFQIDEKLENPSQQKKEKTRGKPILDFIADQ